MTTFLQAAEAVAVSEETRMGLWTLFTKGGWLMWPLLALGGVTIFIFVERFLAIRRASAQQIDDGRQGQQQPEQDECGRAVDVAGDKGGTLDFFENGCRDEYTQHEGQQAKGESFEYLHCMERGFFIPRNADAQCAGISQHGVQEGRVC